MWPALAAGQQRPPLQGTIALEGTVDATYKAANSLMVKTADGVRHLFHVTDRTAVHGSRQAAAEFLHGLREGTAVVVHYADDAGERTAVEVDRVGDEGLKTMEGVVVRVDRAGRKISILLADGSRQTLRLTEARRIRRGQGRRSRYRRYDTSGCVLHGRVGPARGPLFQEGLLTARFTRPTPR